MTEPTTIEDQPNAVPCKIYVDFREGYFDVSDVGAWQYTDMGVFATGRWFLPRLTAGSYRHDVDEADVLIPYDSINFIHFDWDALEAFMADNTTEEVTDGAGA